MNKEVKRKKREKLRNKKLVKKYYFLKPTPWYRKKKWKYDYSFIEWYGWPEGWNKAFGMMYLKELGAEIKRIGQKNFQILQQKEKFGMCINYTSGTSEEAHNIIRKYEYLSQNICWDCGRPDVPMIDNGWIHPVCLDCYIKAERHRDKHISEYNKDYIPRTDEELKEHYKDCITEDPDENGEYRLANSYTIKRFSKDGDEIITYDISKTAVEIRERWERRRKRYEKWVHSRRHSS